MALPRNSVCLKTKTVSLNSINQVPRHLVFFMNEPITYMAQFSLEMGNTKKMKALLIVLSVVALAACTKNENANETTTLKIRMTDAPAAWDEVNVDLQEVRVNFADDSSGWVALQTNAGIYDLLTLQNGIDTLIAQGTVPTGNVKEIRLLLGSGNTIVVNGQTYPLTIPSGGSSGLKIKVNKNLAASVDSLLIDFDAALSIKDEGGSYKLRPVIKLK